jgi:hypothetical protein
MKMMAETKLEQLARKTEKELALLQNDFAALISEVRKVDLLQMQERMAVLEEQMRESKKAREETDKRH